MSETSNTIGPEVSALFAEARQFALGGDRRSALGKNEEALDLAKTPMEELLAHRWIGVCYHHLEQPENSASELRQALDLAKEHKHRQLQLKVLNHLGASLRRQGRLDEARQMFEEGIEAAVGPDLLEARARLWGNLGALWDELGQRSRADDAYARYEELSRILAHDGDPGQVDRLVNALGLAGRAALKRGDLQGAQLRVCEAERLMTAYGLKGGADGITKRRAEIRVACAQAPARESQPTLPDDLRTLAPRDLLREADQLYGEAISAVPSSSQESRTISLLVGRAKCANLLGELQRAHQDLDDAWRRANDLKQSEEIAKVAENLAEICSSVGLEGEALWYLDRAIGTRHEVYSRIDNDRVRHLAQPRLDAIHTLARRLVTSAETIHLTESERTKIRDVLERCGLPGSIPEPQITTPMTWSKRLREDSRLRWGRLLGAAFDSASPFTQEDLICSDVVYHGAVDDLGRSAHLLVVVLERELRTRVFDGLLKEARSPEWRSDPKARKVAKHHRPRGLGETLVVIKDLLDPHPKSSDPSAFELHMRAILTTVGDLLLSLAECVEEPITALDGSVVSIRQLRNQIAHGDKSFPLSRLTIDAVRRRLTLGSQPILRSMLEMTNLW